jgi:hypothetical protein
MSNDDSFIYCKPKKESTKKQPVNHSSGAARRYASFRDALPDNTGEVESKSSQRVRDMWLRRSGVVAGAPVVGELLPV